MTKERVLELIKMKIIEVVPDLENVDIQPNQSFKELGTNSIERTEIIMLIMEELSVNIPRIELLEAKNIGTLAELFDQKLQITKNKQHT